MPLLRIAAASHALCEEPISAGAILGRGPRPGTREGFRVASARVPGVNAFPSFGREALRLARLEGLRNDL